MSVLEQELHTTEDVMDLVVVVGLRLDRLAVEILRGKKNVLEECIVCTNLNALRVEEGAVLRRSNRCIAEEAVGDVCAPRALICSICALVGERVLIGLLQAAVIGRNRTIARVCDRESAVLIKAIAEVAAPDIHRALARLQLEGIRCILRVEVVDADTGDKVLLVILDTDAVVVCRILIKGVNRILFSSRRRHTRYTVVT